MKKLLVAMLSAAAAVCCAVGFSACGDEKSQETESATITIEQAYEQSTVLGFEGTLDEFIALISGKDGTGITSASVNSDGDLIIVLSDGAFVNCGKVVGADGNDGIDGSDGQDGTDGKGIDTAYINSNGELIIRYTDGTETNCGRVVGADGNDGNDGSDGQDGKDGTDGSDGQDGKDGENTTAHIHSFSEWSVGLEATCTSIGYYIRTCTDCGYAEYEFTEANGHEWDSGIVIKQSDCTQTGLTLYVCIHCHTVKAEKIAKSAHNYIDGECTVCHKQLTAEGFEIELNEDGESYSITGLGNCTETEIILPSSYNGKPVTAIGENAFKSSGLETISIPSSIRSMGAESFSACSSLSNVYYLGSVDDWCTISFATFTGSNPLFYANNLYINNQLVTELVIENAQYISNYAFANFKGLTSVYIGGNCVSICTGAFYGCRYLKDLTISGEVTSIGERAFASCIRLENANIAGAVTEIGDYAFFNCNALTEVTIPGTVTEIGRNSFYFCRNLESITIPVSLTRIGRSAFLGCKTLTSVNYDGSIADWCAIYFEDYGATPLRFNSSCGLYIDGKLVTQIIIPEGVTSIGQYAFYGYQNLTDLVVSGSVTSIGEWAFSDCDNLSTVTLFNGITEIGAYSFYSCSSLINIKIPESVTSIGGYAFLFCTSLLSVVFEDKEGWQRSVIGKEGLEEEISETDLQDYAKAAKLLTEKYILRFPEGGYTERAFLWTKTQQTEE